MVTKFAENYYSFRQSSTLIDAIQVSNSPDAASLADIEATLVAANQAFLQRKYQEAITDYQDAAAMIYGLIDPQFHYGGSRLFGELPVDTKLFPGLMSVAAEYLNVLPINTPDPGPRSRVQLSPELLQSTSVADRTGISSSQVASAKSTDAFSDWQLAQSYAASGMTRTAAFYQQRAQKTDPALVNTLQQSNRKTNGTTQTGTRASLGLSENLSMSRGTEAAQQTVETATQSASDTAVIERVDTAAAIGSVSPLILEKIALPSTILEGRSAGTIVNNKLVQFNWAAGDGPPVDTITSSVYNARISLQQLPDILLQPQQPSDVALALPHDYYYVIPLGLAECYHALGDYVNAEKYYLQAAGYQYINTAIEAPYVWLKLATNYADWGDSLFKNGQAPNALPIYANVLTADFKAPTSQLYALANFAGPAADGKTVISALPDPSALTLNPQVIAVILDVYQQIIKIQNGLDFWGNWSNVVPVWTFDYLQQVAGNFAQLAVSAERDVINFWNSADQAQLTRQQLSDAVDQSKANANAAQMQVQAQQAQEQVYKDGVALAQLRASDAQSNANLYQALAPQWAQLQAAQSQVQGGDDGDTGQLDSLAQQLLSTGSISGSSGTVGAAAGLAGNYVNQKYELAGLQQEANEMNSALTQAQASQTAAHAATQAAQAAATAAQVRVTNSQNDLNAFDSQTFTPDVWNRMGNTMKGIYDRYFTWAIKVAQLMQQAYNFETDQLLAIIKNSYATDEVNGLLGADLLMADIESFTYDLITGTNTKPQPIKQTISLAQRYSYQFESQFRTTGILDFSTSLDDFENLYPGTYAGRIETIEVTVEGIVPPTGLSGSLTNTGISTYRLPGASWSDTNNGIKFRVQPSETLIISDYSPRVDPLVDPTNPNLMKIFQGAGVASTWHFELPMSINDVDYGAITDVKLTFSYQARYDNDMKSQVLTAIVNTPGFNERQLSLPLKWFFPDAFFAFQRTGTLGFSLKQSDFPSNQRAPQLTDVAIVVATADGTSNQGITFGLSTPGQAPINATTDVNGQIQSSTTGSPWAPLATGTSLGNFALTVTAADNPALVKNGVLTLDGIVNVALVLGYSFTVRS